MQKIKRKKISFTLEAVDAKEVYLLGEFNNWKHGAHPMKNNGKGRWAKQLQLPEGRFEYKFLVDNQWVADPENEWACPNCFGTRNSIVNVGK
ncbi:MAG: glycogen-binding domain-containing protein [Proteobacteria bacterium]|nr:glycogen-binding domain-containing protein [Pseudomonadota bacterium]MBU1585808.1 glycogen-binding domain-containing protein [Pseudomonadota bacterium]MBU2451987.1 glycogen-binding domain-containing protein [Pseudomonadota bacterium]MBU2627227.1 glycogen-binding domain-containing protein [Pseudomonadota bacterium]